MKRIFLIWLVLWHLPLLSQQDTARIMYYNVLNFPGSTPERIAHFKLINQYINPDIILVNELLSDEGAISLLQDGLNVYGITKYDKAEFTNGPDSDNLLFYNNEKFALYSQDTIQTQLRLINEYVLFYKSEGLESGDTTFLFMYSAHLKASTGTTNKLKRLAEVMQFKSHVNSNPNIENLFFGGDLNLYTYSEPAYDTLINYGLYPLTDVLPAGSWHDNLSFANIHTQSTRTLQFGGGASGGLDDRFDFILFSEDIINGNNNITYLQSSMQSVGNDGNHLNMAITDSPVNPNIPDSVLQALYYMTDHLPVICDIAIEYNSIPAAFDLDLKVVLEGPFNGTDMNSDLNILNEIPLNQPYNIDPWNYNGNESVAAIPSTNIIDWILIELRDTTDAAIASGVTRFAQKAGFLLKNGNIVDNDGVSFLHFDEIVIDSLFVVLWHRNHLGIMSAIGLTRIGNTYSYDFTISANQIYGFETGIKVLNNDIWGMIAGDGNGDGHINNLDKTDTWSIKAGKPGYLGGDFNMNGQVSNSDKDEFWLINNLRNCKVPE